MPDTLRRHERRNTLGISAVEAAWGLALPVLVESTFLQVYLGLLGAPAVVVGLVPAIFAAGTALGAPLASLWTSHLVHKRRAVIWLHLAAAAPILAYGLALPFLPPGAASGAFLIAYALFAFGVGITLPVWNNFLVAIFEPGREARTLATMFVVQTVFRLAGGLAITAAAAAWSTSAAKAALVFVAGGLLFAGGTFFFLLVRERPAPSTGAAPPAAHDLASLGRACSGLLKNRRFLAFILSMTENAAVVAAVSFLARYAVTCRGIDPGIAAGLFAAALAGGAIGGFALGWIRGLSTAARQHLGKAATVAGIALALLARDVPAFLAACAVLGFSRGAFGVSFPSAVRGLAGKTDATDAFGAVSMACLPVAFLVPWLAGHVIDGLGGGTAAFTWVYGALLALALLGWWGLLRARLGDDSAA